MAGELPPPLIRIPIEAVQHDYNHLATMGYCILVFTWMLFVVTVGSMFQLWKFVILPFYPLELYYKMYSILSVIDGYIMTIWSVYIVIWLWAVVSWIGLKLFRQSKGLLVES